MKSDSKPWWMRRGLTVRELRSALMSQQRQIESLHSRLEEATKTEAGLRQAASHVGAERDRALADVCLMFNKMEEYEREAADQRVRLGRVEKRVSYMLSLTKPTKPTKERRAKK